MKRLAEENWFPLFTLLTAVMAATLWYLAQGTLSWQPLLIALFPGFIRLAAGKLPFPRTPFDSFIILFLFTAVIGVWAAYDRTAAWGKFWILVGAVLIYYALAGQKRRTIWQVAGGMGAVSTLFALYFLLTHDWVAWPADIGFLTRIGVVLMRIRPSLDFPQLHPNIVGGIIAVQLPLLAACGYYAWRKRQRVLLGITAVASTISLFAFLLTSSRAAWLSLFFAIVIWLLWRLCLFAPHFMALSPERLYTGILLTLAVIGLLVVLFVPNSLQIVISRLPGIDSSTSRLQLMRQATTLISDFPFTGGGLAAFAGLHSSYVRLVPHFIFNYSHNFYLDIFLEQGFMGFLALMAIMAKSLWLLYKHHSLHTAKSISKLPPSYMPTNGLRWALCISLLTLLVHGVMDDALYGGMGTPLLFVIPGITMAIATIRHQKKRGLVSNERNQPGMIALGITAVFIATIALLSYRFLLANWYADLGAVTMARIELADWPTGEWDDGRHLDRLAPAAALFEKALQIEPNNTTANFYLGLMAILARDYETAVSHLEIAPSGFIHQRGVSKSLGYTYVWQGDLDKATELLLNIPEATDEMQVYIWWWETQNRSDLSQKAKNMAGQLENRDG
jgi:O-antigen ligase